MDYERTQQYYTDAKQKWEKRHDQIEWEKWQKRVKDTAGNWNQNPHDRDTVYPRVKYSNLIRVKAKDGKEYLTTRSMHTGVNAYGDEQTHSVVDPEMYTETKWNHRRIPDPNDRNNIITEAHGVLSAIDRYELPFDPDKAREMYNNPDDGGCFLTILDRNRDGPPREVTSIDDFCNRSFDDMMYGIKPNANERKPSK